MPYDKDLRDLMVATKSVSRSIDDAIGMQRKKRHPEHETTLVEPFAKEDQAICREPVKS